MWCSRSPRVRPRKSRSAIRRPRSERCSSAPPRIGIAATWRASWGDYARDSMTSYVSGGHVQYGWQALYDHYRASYFTPGPGRDSLRCEEIQVRPLTTDLAFCTARFRLTRGAAVTASGPFTLILQKRGDRWYILHDHTSSDPRP